MLSAIFFCPPISFDDRDMAACGKNYTHLPERAIAKSLIYCNCEWYSACHSHAGERGHRMLLMSRLRRLPSSILLAPVLLAWGCSRPASLQDLNTAPAGQPQIPFNGSEHQSNQVRQAASPMANDGGDFSSKENVPPFRDSLNLPAGTLLTVRLANAISADGLSHNPFDAILENPVVLDGVTVIPQGARAIGFVESAHSSEIKSNGSYVRLKLSSIYIAGHNLPVQTSSLFAKANLKARSQSDGPDNVIYVSKGRRFTFQLSGPVVLASQKDNLVP